MSEFPSFPKAHTMWSRIRGYEFGLRLYHMGTHILCELFDSNVGNIEAGCRHGFAMFLDGFWSETARKAIKIHAFSTISAAFCCLRRR